MGAWHVSCGIMKLSGSATNYGVKMKCPITAVLAIYGDL
jgi:hypothetical protein